MIDFSVIWNCSMNAPSLTFILEQVDPHPRKLRCIFAIFQQGVQSSTPLEIAVSLVLPLMKQVCFEKYFVEYLAVKSFLI